MGLVTTAALNTKSIEIENKKPDISNLVTKAPKISDTISFITTSEFNILTKLIIASKSEVNDALDLGDKNRKNKKT